jgi:adenylosuccinate synthase
MCFSPPLISYKLIWITYSIGTTKKGIGPAYSAKASRSGLRVHHLFDATFADKFRKIVEGRYKRYGHFEYDTEGEIERYKVRGFERAPAAISLLVRPMSPLF